MASTFDYSYHCNKRQRRQNKCGQFQVPRRYRPEDHVRSFQRQSGPYHRTPAARFNFAGSNVRPDREMRSLACAVYQPNVQLFHAQVPHTSQKSSWPQSQAPVDVGELFQKLVASGLIPETKVSDPAPMAPQEKAAEKRVKKCKTCDSFLPEFEYSAHLQWHYDEIQRRKLDVKRQDLSTFGDNGLKALAVVEKKMQPDQHQMASISCSSGENSCKVCRENFEQFFHEEQDEWHLKNAVLKNGFTVHVSCADDLDNPLPLES
jgi:hypothetical protein